MNNITIRRELGKELRKMAVALKEMNRRNKERYLTIAPCPKAEEKKMEYEFPYDEMYLLYDYILEEMKKNKRG